MSHLPHKMLGAMKPANVKPGGFNYARKKQPESLGHNNLQSNAVHRQIVEAANKVLERNYRTAI